MKKIRVTRNLVIIFAATLLLGGTVASALSALFTQTIPGESFSQSVSTSSSSSSSGAVIAEGSCGDNPVLDTKDSTVPTSEGQSAALLFSCSTSSFTSGAFSVSNAGSATPTFNLPKGWSLSLAVWNTVSTTISCTSGTVALTSGTPVSFSTVGFRYDYCLTSSSALNFTSFGVTWSQ